MLQNALCLLCSVDNSESAFLNEDYPGTRWGYQRQALTSLCGQYALQSGNSKEAAHTTCRQSRAGISSMCVVAAGNARLQHPPCPIRGCDAALASLLDLEMAEGPHSQYQKALLLAAVNFTLFRHTSMCLASMCGRIIFSFEATSIMTTFLPVHPLPVSLTLHGVISIFLAIWAFGLSQASL